MVSKRQHDTFEQRAQEIFAASTERLDAATRSRLTQARYAALQAARARAHWANWKWGLPAGLAAVLALSVLTNWRTADPPVPNALDDLSIVAASDNLELLEDVDFYAWLAERDAAPVDGSG